MTNDELQERLKKHRLWLRGEEGGERLVAIGANLQGANLRDANLRDANLQGADLQGADLAPIKADVWLVLASAPAEIAGLRAALVEGRVDGSTYEGECACLVGTLANVAKVEYDEIPGLMPDSSRPAERFFLAITTGDTPETCQASALALQWVDEFIAAAKATAAALS